ncbi:MAG TPA: PAS domain S-box protein [Myxococcaceae bacterium]|nr:PAS domain S-box protein [Myxococcaceae bacterium]
MDSFMGGDLDFSLLEAIGALVMVADREGRVVWWNEACQELTGYSLEEVRGEQFWTKVLLTEELEGVRETFDALAAGGPPSRFENFWRTRDGRKRWIAWSNNVLRELDGQVRYVIGTGVDITERKQAQEESTRLLGQVNWLRVVIDTAPIGVIVRLPSGAISFNRRAEEIFGTHLVPELGPQQYLELLHHPDGTPLTPEEQPFSRLLESGESIEKEEFLVRRPDGSTALIRKSATPIRDAEGRVTSGVAILEDITERKRVEESLHASEALLRHVIDALPVGVWIADASGRIVNGNQASRQIWGGVRYVEVPRYDEYRAWWADTGEPLTSDDWALARAIRKGETSLGEVLRIQCFDGSLKTIRNSAVPLRDPKGHIIGGIVVNEDITTLLETEAALREAIQDREHILAIVSHDLRNPLNTIMLTIGQLQRLLPPEVAGPRTEKALASLTSATQRMGRLIDDLLDMTRLETGQLSLKRGHHPVARLVADALDVLRPMASRTHHELRTELRAGADVVEVDADRDRVVQVFSNLVGNAIKFTPEGGHITLVVEPGVGEVRFAVRDTGPGFSREEQSHLFERFWQAGQSDRRGIGLGLSICKGIVEAHGGRIWAESQPGEGSTFFFTLPAAHPQTEQTAPG